MSKQALAWLRENQLPNGTWGAEAPLYYHDRVISTISAITALVRYGDKSDKERIERAIPSLTYALTQLHKDESGETVAFEMLIPTFLAEAKSLELIRFRDDALLRVMHRSREKKLARSPGGMISRHVTMAYSSEMAGLDGIHLLDKENLQEDNGSIGCSPAATAYFVLNVSPGNEAGLNYLKHVNNDYGGYPLAAPINIFERAWVLWNLKIALPFDAELMALAQPHLKVLQQAWREQSGVGFSIHYTPPDSDDTSVVFEVLARFGHSPSLDTLHSYELETHYRCYALEANPSISANIHILNALQFMELPQQHPSVQKILTFLKEHQIEAGYWYDKWHSSPYYVTGHAIIAIGNYDEVMAQTAVNWILNNQNEDGSWGYHMPTAEETAYSLQALAIWHQQGHHVPRQALQNGLTWLQDHQAPPYPPLWISKSLYTPYKVVHATIISAQILVNNIL